MKEFSQRDIKDLFSNLCCSRCKNDFSKESLTIKKKVKNIYICNLSCQKCGKDFGDVVFQYNSGLKNHTALRMIEGADPISYDDVIDAHNYIKRNM